VSTFSIITIEIGAISAIISGALNLALIINPTRTAYFHSGVSEKRLAITTYGKVRYPLKSATPFSCRRDSHPNLLKIRLLTPESLWPTDRGS
jgi:hypothetical protein